MGLPGRISVALLAFAFPAFAAEKPAPNPEDLLRLDAEKLLAAARADEKAGRTDAARVRLETFVNVHVRSPQRPEALLSLARLYRTSGRGKASERTYAWLVEAYPDSPEAAAARVESLETRSPGAASELATGYERLIREAPDARTALTAAARLFDRLLTEHRPLEAIVVLSELAADPKGGLGPLAAKQALRDGLDRALAALVKAGDDGALVAAAGKLEEAALVPSKPRQAEILAALERLGLAGPEATPLEQAVRDGRRAALAGRWPEAESTLKAALDASGEAPPAVEAEAVALYAEALWRAGAGDAALDRIAAALTLPIDPAAARPLVALRADILFVAGRHEEACADYRAALVTATTPWVESQAKACPSPAVAEEAP
jgi:hypothetical protein